MEKEQRILRVALFTPLRQLFDYTLPLNFDPTKSPAPGMRVSVPFGKSTRIGIIASITQHSDYDINKLKPAHAILDDQPLFPKTLLSLIDWASQYYHSSLGEVFDCALPVWLCKGKSSALFESALSESTLSESTLSESESTLSEKENNHHTQIIKAPKIKTTKKNSVAPSLNSEQQHAVNFINAELAKQKFKVFLLEGITGSGKTEVYIQAIEQCLNHKRQALILVPEIGLTPQMLERLQERFSVPIAVLHSAVAEKKRFKAWQQAALGLAPIIIGTRSAAFTPLKEPGLFIIDEEHDPSFKQQDNFRYSARDLLIMRASLENCPIVLGSATPSLETQQNTKSGRYLRLPLPKRAGNANPPSIQILDIRHKKLDEGLSAQLIKQMHDHLNDKGQVLLFLNRRGFAPVLMCYGCGYIANCNQCDARLTVHNKTKKLRCHHCEYTTPLPSQCPSCQSKNLKPLGVGTERLEAALKHYFHDKEIIRIDRDTTRQKGKMQDAVAKIHNNEANILIGTQMIAKGHHFPNVTLVGILDTDHALFSTDFRSLERFGQLITQVAGRAGRAERLGHVIIQTCHPEHPLMNTLIHNGYTSFSDSLLLERRSTQLPPFSYQVLIRADAKKNETAFNFLQRLKTKTLELVSTKENNLTILGPVTAPMERKEGQYRAQLLMQSSKRIQLQTLMKQLVDYAETLPACSRALRWSLDVDPIDMF